MGGGALAFARPDSITFDASEKWEISGRQHHLRAIFDWDEQYFAFLPVALHEIGHCLGLGHSNNAEDVMSPFYAEARNDLSENDVSRVKEWLAIRSPRFRVRPR